MIASGPLPTAEEAGKRTSFLRWVLPAVLFLAGVSAIVFGQSRWMRLQLREGLPRMIAGVILVVLAALPVAHGRHEPISEEKRLRRWEKWFLVILVIGGGFLRFVDLDRWPPGGFFDEVQNHFVAEEILAGSRPIFVGGATQMPALPFYLLAVAIKICGRGLATVRGMSALFGTVTLPVFYLLARRAFAWPVAAASALMLAGSRWHITFSRVGFVTIVGPLLEVASVLVLWKAMSTRRRGYYLLLGLIGGVGLQTYYSFNLFPAVLLVAVLTYSFRTGWRSVGRELGRIAGGLALSVLVAGVLLIPLIRFVVRQPTAFFQRGNTVALWNPAHRLPWPGALWINTATHLLMFNYHGDGNPRHNIPDAPMLNPIEGVLLAVGLGATLARWIKWPQATWLAWFVVMLLPAILTIEAPQAHRAVGVIPAVYLIIGQGLNNAYALVDRRRRRPAAAIAAVFLLILGTAVASTDVVRYFRVQVRNNLVWQAFQADYHEVAKFVRPFRDRYDIRVSGLYFDYPILKFYLGETFPYDRFQLSKALPSARSDLDARRDGAVYVLEPFQTVLCPLFRSLYPHCECKEHPDPFGRTMFVSVLVPRQDLSRETGSEQMGFLGVYYPNERWEGDARVVRRDPAIVYHFHWDREALADPFTADWAAHLHIQQRGDYTFDVTTSGPTLVIVDDRPIIVASDFEGPYSRSGTVDLSEGDHLLVVRYFERSFASTISLLWRPPSGVASVIPMNRLRPLAPEEYARLRDRLPAPPIR